MKPLIHLILRWSKKKLGLTTKCLSRHIKQRRFYITKSYLLTRWKFTSILLIRTWKREHCSLKRTMILGYRELRKSRRQNSLLLVYWHSNVTNILRFSSNYFLIIDLYTPWRKCVYVYYTLTYIYIYIYISFLLFITNNQWKMDL